MVVHYDRWGEGASSSIMRNLKKKTQSFVENSQMDTRNDLFNNWMISCAPHSAFFKVE